MTILSIYGLVLCGAIICIRAYWLPVSGRSRKNNRTATSLNLCKTLLIDMLVLAVVVAAASRTAMGLQTPLLIHLALSILGTLAVGLFFAAHREMGVCWAPPGTLRPNRRFPMIRKGPYRYFLHPIYFSILCFGFALGFLWDTWLVLALTVWQVWMLRKSAQKEERKLREKFGQAYLRHMDEVWVYFPSSARFIIYPRAAAAKRKNGNRRGAAAKGAIKQVGQAR